MSRNRNKLAVPLALESQAVFLFGTGIRNATALTASVGGRSVPVLFGEAQGSFSGLDQVNIGPLPQDLQGSGQQNVLLTADGQAANAVK